MLPADPVAAVTKENHPLSAVPEGQRIKEESHRSSATQKGLVVNEEGHLSHEKEEEGRIEGSHHLVAVRAGQWAIGENHLLEEMQKGRATKIEGHHLSVVLAVQERREKNQLFTESPLVRLPEKPANHVATQLTVNPDLCSRVLAGKGAL